MQKTLVAERPQHLSLVHIWNMCSLAHHIIESTRSLELMQCITHAIYAIDAIYSSFLFLWKFLIILVNQIWTCFQQFPFRQPFTWLIGMSYELDQVFLYTWSPAFCWKTFHQGSHHTHISHYIWSSDMKRLCMYICIKSNMKHSYHAEWYVTWDRSISLFVLHHGLHDGFLSSIQSAVRTA